MQIFAIPYKTWPHSFVLFGTNIANIDCIVDPTWESHLYKYK